METKEKEIRQAISESLAEMKDCSEENKKKLEQVMTDIFVYKVLPKDAMELGQEMVDTFYGMAYRSFKSGKLDDGIALFKWLMFLDPIEPKYPLGLAACYHMKKNYNEAIKNYMVAAYIDQSSPIPYFHISDCFIELKKPGAAIIALANLIERAGDDKQYEMIVERAKMSLKSLQNEIEETEKKKEETKEQKKAA